VTANDCQNSDLFWALRGGGGGAFGVVTSVTIRTFPDVLSITHNINITITDTENFWSMLTEFHDFIPTIDDVNGSGYYLVFPKANTLSLVGIFVGKSNATFVQHLFEPFLEKARKYNPKIDQFTTPPVNTSYGLNLTLSSSDVVGQQLLLGSRLVSRKFLESDDGPGRLTEVFRKLAPNQNNPILGAVVAGGQVAKYKDIDSALNPSWREALILVLFARAWDSTTSFEEQAVIAKNLTNVEVPILAALEPDMGTYINEADMNEKNWQEVFWGENYPNLLKIKEKWDRKGLFMCKPCVGSENWDSESICRVK
jgi:hypothetical protein